MHPALGGHVPGLRPGLTPGMSLAIVLTARAYGLPLDAVDLDLVRRAIDRDAPDLAPLLARVVERLVHVYGRDAVRIVLTSG